ncbi:MAG: phosphoglycolate phosphatase [Alphaproteobacteria bacterium]|nr:phosphoglycolate phosphatase [Alphaproteobacteria bacterium]
MSEAFVLLFDLDGTLIDSVPDLCAALNQMLRERGRAPLTPQEVAPMVGDGMPALVSRALAARGLDPVETPALLPRYVALYEANAANLTRPYPHVPETLELLRRRGYRLGICTNKLQRPTMVVLRALGLSELFDAVAGGDRFPVKKPDGGHVLGLIDLLYGRADRAAMIGDHENDAAAAKAAKVPILLMRYGYARGDLATLGCDALLDDFAELPAVLDRLGLTPTGPVSPTGRD